MPGDRRDRDWVRLVRLMPRELGWAVTERIDEADLAWSFDKRNVFEPTSSLSYARQPVPTVSIPTVSSGAIPAVHFAPKTTTYRVVALLTNTEPPRVVRMVDSTTRRSIVRGFVSQLEEEISRFRRVPRSVFFAPDGTHGPTCLGVAVLR